MALACLAPWSVAQTAADGMAGPDTKGPSSDCTDRISFSGIPTGTIPSQVFSDMGEGPVFVRARNPVLGNTNAAVIFNSSFPTGEDPDLGSPNETFGGPGIGPAGEMGMPFENAIPLGKLLIVGEDLVDANNDGRVDDPDDADEVGSLIAFDFQSLGTVTVQAMTIIDVEPDRPPPTVVLFGPGGTVLGSTMLPQPGDNGVAQVDLADVLGVQIVLIILNGSGGIADFCFEVDEDCNDNGVPDEIDIALGTSQDCDNNGIPDECQPDCDMDGIPDVCEPDCDNDGIPDDCEPDCDNDGIPDDCEPDCDNDGIPDDCEPDCDNDGIPDDCEPDCDNDGIPDDCEPDCDNDGIPDDCEPDCDNDGIPDDCEDDCDDDGVPDDCDDEPDCNNNGIPDNCDIADGTSDDCDNNGVPDECQPDCDNNGIPDVCEPDCDNDGTPDACEPDCDNDGIPDDCEDDCDNDGTPDDCEPDCDNDGIPDDCEDDCDNDGTPDDCEPDCDNDGIPDDCEPDCDNDGTPDDCEPDCDNDGIPDDCEDDPDCNSNGIPDSCEPDCDSDGIPDDCEPDCDNDGIPDDCEPDCDNDGVPDDCEDDPDCNSNGVPDSCDPDCDNDGIPDDCEVDCDNDGIPDDCEPDCDGDGIPDECDDDPGFKQVCDVESSPTVPDHPVLPNKTFGALIPIDCDSFYNQTSRFDWAPGTTFTEHPDGTATLVGVLVNEVVNGSLSVDMTFFGRVDPGDSNYPPAGGSPYLGLFSDLPDHYFVENGGTIDTDTWHYYTSATGMVTGNGEFNGLSMTWGFDPNVDHAFQVGVGATGRHLELGASGWMDTDVHQQPYDSSYCFDDYKDQWHELFLDLECEDVCPSHLTLPDGGASFRVGQLAFEIEDARLMRYGGAVGLVGSAVSTLDPSVEFRAHLFLSEPLADNADRFAHVSGMVAGANGGVWLIDSLAEAPEIGVLETGRLFVELDSDGSFSLVPLDPVYPTLLGNILDVSGQ